jgi:hypothetical protein
LETLNSKKNVGFIFHPSFCVGSGMKQGRIRIRDEKIFGSESGIRDKTFRIRNTDQMYSKFRFPNIIKHSFL